jgi:hypothetical protein
VAAKAYQTNQYATPVAGVAGSGLQQSASGSVVGFDANVTATRNFQRIGAAVVPNAFILWDGSIP